MNTKKLGVEILQTGAHNDAILKMVASHNGRISFITPSDIVGYCNCRRAEFPGIYGKAIAVLDSPTKVLVSEDGGASYTLVIEEQEIIT